MLRVPPVFPREEFIGRIPNKPLAELEEEGWPVLKEHQGFKQVPDLNGLERYLRNTISHCNIDFL